MLAVVEHDEGRSIGGRPAEILEGARSELGRRRFGQPVVGVGCQTNEVRLGAPVDIFQHRLGEPGLTGAARSHDGHQPPLVEKLDDLPQLLVASDERPAHVLNRISRACVRSARLRAMSAGERGLRVWWR